MRLSEADKTRIAEAVAAAERRTTGEVLCVLAKRTSSYREVPLAWGTAAALVLPLLLLWAGLKPLDLAASFGQWTAAHAAADDATVALALAGYALAQTVIFAVVVLIVSIGPVRRLLTPGFLKARRVRKAALAHFAGTGLDGSPERTGVLIYAAFDEHRVEVIADALIHEKVGGDGVWDSVVAEIRKGMRGGDPGAGFASAIAICGDVLARHFPDDGGPNRMSDRPVEV